MNSTEPDAVEIVNGELTDNRFTKNMIGTDWDDYELCAQYTNLSHTNDLVLEALPENECFRVVHVNGISDLPDTFCVQARKTSSGIQDEYFICLVR